MSIEKLRKIYRSITVDMETGRVEDEDSFLYAGPLELWKSSPSPPPPPSTVRE